MPRTDVNLPPSHRGRSADEILSEMLYYDSAGYLYRAVSWLEHFDRMPRFTTLLYCCIEARMGVEYLLFEELVLSTGAKLTRNDYERCLRGRKSFSKLIRQLSPDHKKAQEFTRAVARVDTGAPTLIYWDSGELESAWGQLSRYLHWNGTRNETTQTKEWVNQAGNAVRGLLVPLWEKFTSGPSGLLHPSEMTPTVYDVWEDYKAGRINLESVEFRLRLL